MLSLELRRKRSVGDILCNPLFFRKLVRIMNFPYYVVIRG